MNGTDTLIFAMAPDHPLLKPLIIHLKPEDLEKTPEDIVREACPELSRYYTSRFIGHTAAQGEAEALLESGKVKKVIHLEDSAISMGGSSCEEESSNHDDNDDNDD